MDEQKSNCEENDSEPTGTITYLPWFQKKVVVANYNNSLFFFLLHGFSYSSLLECSLKLKTNIG